MEDKLVENKLNKKQSKRNEVRNIVSLNTKLFNTKLLLSCDYEICRGDELCCGLGKTATSFSPSALKCICKDCSKNIKEKKRLAKIEDNEKLYILGKIKASILRVGVFSSTLKCSEEFFYAWIKSQSTDTFNEHLDHVLPINSFRWFTPASEYLALRDSWINIMPLARVKNLQKGSKVNLSLFSNQLKVASEFISKYDFKTEDEKEDIGNHFLKIERLFRECPFRECH